MDKEKRAFQSVGGSTTCKAQRCETGRDVWGSAAGRTWLDAAPQGRATGDEAESGGRYHSWEKDQPSRNAGFSRR